MASWRERADEYEDLKKEEHRFYRYINVVFQMIIICSGILFFCCCLVSLSFLCLSIIWQTFRQVLCLFYFYFYLKFQTLRPAQNTNTNRKRKNKIKTNQKSTRFLSIFCVCRLRLRAALSAFRYTCFVASASNACRWQTERR